MIKNLKSLLIIMCFVMAIASTAYGTTYTYTMLSADGYSTWPTGINNAGVIVGYAGDATGTAPFLYEGGQLYWRLYLPGATNPNAPYSQFTGINNSGTIVGWYFNSLNYYVTGFSLVGATLTPDLTRGSGYDVGGTFTTIAFPLSQLLPPQSPTDVLSLYRTYPLAINDAGDIVGYAEADYNLGGSNAYGIWEGFLYSAGTYTPILPPGVSYAEATGINDSGEIVGYTTAIVAQFDVPGYGTVRIPAQVGFLDKAGSFSYFQDPNVASVGQGPFGYPLPGETCAFGINNLGDIVGYYYGQNPNGYNTYVGFVDHSGSFSSVSFPQSDPAGWTYVNAINDSGTIVGVYGDVGGYVAVPIPVAPTPEPATLLLLGPGLAGLWLWGRKKFKYI